MHADPTTSTRCHPWEFSLLKSTLRRISFHSATFKKVRSLKELLLHPYREWLTQPLHVQDYRKRLLYPDHMLENNVHINNFLTNN